MKLSKYLIFKIEKQKFAIKIHRVLNILEMARLIEGSLSKPYQKGIISFKGAMIPLIDLREIIGMPPSRKPLNECVLVLELKINGKMELAGMAIDEISEISEIDDLMLYPYNGIYNNPVNQVCEGLVIMNNEPLIMINSDKIVEDNRVKSRVTNIMSFYAN
jgi:chemotaxis signal transduction protein